jgi:hypothetical protein
MDIFDVVPADIDSEFPMQPVDILVVSGFLLLLGRLIAGSDSLRFRQWLGQ